jgi:hypothetical protein
LYSNEKDRAGAVFDGLKALPPVRLSDDMAMIEREKS